MDLPVGTYLSPYNKSPPGCIENDSAHCLGESMIECCGKVSLRQNAIPD